MPESNKRGRPRTAGGRAQREEQRDQDARSPRRKKIDKIVNREIRAFESEHGSLGDLLKPFRAGGVLIARRLVPVEPVYDALLGIQGDRAATTDEAQNDNYPPGYRHQVAVPGFAYDIYCAVFDLIHGVDDPSAAMSAQATLDGYEIKQK
jgi:hypothetical protein